MKRQILKNKPLIEAIFELRWQMQEVNQGVHLDPHYKIFVGSFYDRIKKTYSFHEQLPAVNLPEEIASYVVQHRFRTTEKGWPLIQIGPGIVTLNDTDGYVWPDFQKRIVFLIDKLFEVYPDPKKLTVKELQLRYIDAVDFDFEKFSALSFLKEKLKVEVSVHDALFKGTGVDSKPVGLDVAFSYFCEKPKGLMSIRFARGQKGQRNAVIWETVLRSRKPELIKSKQSIKTWVNQGHDLTDDWFFKLIEGELFERFK